MWEHTQCFSVFFSLMPRGRSLCHPIYPLILLLIRIRWKSHIEMLLQTKLKLYWSLKTQPLLLSKTITEQKQNNLHCDRCVLSVKPEIQ